MFYGFEEFEIKLSRVVETRPDTHRDRGLGKPRAIPLRPLLLKHRRVKDGWFPSPSG